MLVCTTSTPPPPPKLVDLGTLDLSWSGLPPVKMKIWADLGTLDLSWSGVSPSPLWTYVGAGVWRLIAESPKDTVSFWLCQLVIQQSRVNIGDGDTDQQPLSDDDEETPFSPIIPLQNSVSKKVILRVLAVLDFIANMFCFVIIYDIGRVAGRFEMCPFAIRKKLHVMRFGRNFHRNYFVLEKNFWCKWVRINGNIRG